MDAIAKLEGTLTRGQWLADRVARWVGSWGFVAGQSVLLAAWVAANAILAYLVQNHRLAVGPWDPMPFILLNLMLSFQAAYTGPVVMISQNRQAEKDRLLAQRDYQSQVRTEADALKIMDQLAQQEQLLQEILRRLEERA